MNFITVLDVLFGYIGGVVCAWLILNPTRLYSKGYDDAKKLYTDYERGFHAGFKAAETNLSYDLGFNDGWDCGWQRRDEFYELYERSEE